ncbi:Small ribosomal subunit protein mS23 [Nakaseomyces bracarensis]|uniref:37S ribosomal protein S25, mitochondrial n=1 Tax=Nakaseomyces bracarensis TaxID=273131 RepID=A0ABR4NWZ6_9SACH
MKIQTNAVNVLERTSAYLRTGVIRDTPAWYNVVASIPPVKKFTREPRKINPSTERPVSRLADEHLEGFNSNGLYKTRFNTLDKKIANRQIYRPPKLVYLEDSIRNLFYKQHPWELARPKIIAENEIEMDYDWSRIQQLGKPLDGENVVQRTLYLLKNSVHDNITDAYDQARLEFYRVRIQQELEEQVAAEEAEMFGSVFGPTAIEHGLMKEQEVVAKWKQDAELQTEFMSAKQENASKAAGEDTSNAESRPMSPEADLVDKEVLHF